MSSVSSDITYLVMEKFFPTPTCQTCDHFWYNKMKDMVSSHAYDHSMVIGIFTCDPQLYEHIINNYIN